MQIYFAGALTLAALVAWVLYLRWSPLTPLNNRALYAFAPVGAAWLVALLSPFADQTFYKGAVLLGMLLALLAAVIRTTEFLPSYAAHAHLVITYALYASAFASETQGWPTPYALLLIAAAGLVYYWLYPRLAELWISVAIYGLLILLATWQALELAVQQPATWTSWVALAGMLMLVAATLLEAQARFRQFRPAWAGAALPVFLLAQLVIAWSVWG
jgi:uncharacterized membrane protein YhhN